MLNARIIPYFEGYSGLIWLLLMQAHDLSFDRHADKRKNQAHVVDDVVDVPTTAQNILLIEHLLF